MTCARNDDFPAAGVAVGAKIGVAGGDRGALTTFNGDMGAKGAVGDVFSTNCAANDGFSGAAGAAGAMIGVTGGDTSARGAVGGLGDVFSMRCAGNDDFSAA